MGRHRLAVGGPRPRPEHDERDPGPGPRRDPGRPGGRRGHRPAPRERARALRDLRRHRPLHARRAARRDLRSARHPRPVPPPRPTRHPARGGRARGPQPDPRPGWGRGRDHRHPGGLGRAHPLRRAQLPRLGGDDPRPPPERPQLHRPRLPAAGSHRLPVSRGGFGGRPRPGRERQRPGPALERVPPRRHADERLHELPGGERGRDHPRHRDRARVPRRGERLRRRVRAEHRRADQRHHEVRRQRLPRQRLRVPPQRRPRRPQLLRPRGEAGLPPQPVRLHPRRPGAPRPHVLLRGLRGAAGDARPDDLDRGAQRGGARRRPARARGRHRGRAGQPERASLPRRVPAAERGGARRGPRRLPLPVHPDDRPGLLPGPARPDPERARPAVPPLHVRPGRAVPAHRLSPVPADVRVAEPVRDRGVPAGVLGPDPGDVPARLLAHADRPGGRGQHVPAALAVRARAGVARGDRHRGRPAVRAAGLRRRVDPAGRLRLPRRLPPHPRAAHAEGRRPGRALPVQRGQPDLQPRHPRLRQPRGLPARPLAPLHRPHPRGGPRARVAAHPPRPLRAGRGEPHRAADPQRRPALRVRHPAPRRGEPGREHARSPRPAGDGGPALREPHREERVAPARASPGTSSGTGARRCAAATGSTSTP